MAISAKARVALRKLLKARPYFIPVFQDLANPERHDDRSAALVASTLLEHSLEEAISSRLAPMPPEQLEALFQGDQEREGVFQSFYAKIWMAYALGVFGPETLSDLNSIRAIRNLFAHSPLTVTFGTKEVEDCCHFAFLETIRWGRAFGPKPTSARDRFMIAARHFCLYFSADAINRSNLHTEVDRKATWLAGRILS